MAKKTYKVGDQIIHAITLQGKKIFGTVTKAAYYDEDKQQNIIDYVVNIGDRREDGEYWTYEF